MQLKVLYATIFTCIQHFLVAYDIFNCIRQVEKNSFSSIDYTLHIMHFIQISQMHGKVINVTKTCVD
jgi:hypothetical protein